MKKILRILFVRRKCKYKIKRSKQWFAKKYISNSMLIFKHNRCYIILGANDKKEIVGIKKELIDKIKKDYTTMCNNKQIIEPTIISELKEIKIDGKILLYVHIEESQKFIKIKEKYIFVIMKEILIYQIIFH